MVDLAGLRRHFILEHLKTGGVAVDFTMGNGNDTLKLCKKTGENGKVFAFDIQKTALEETEKKLTENGFFNAKLILASHADMDKFVSAPVSCVIFNLGYLPGGDHSICTHFKSSIKAIKNLLI